LGASSRTHQLKRLKMDKLIIILGPTASGKTELSLKLAKKFEGEIICADSRQVYEEMNIGTATPTPDRQPKTPATEIKNKKGEFLVQGIPHHLFNIVSPDEDFNVVIYKERCLSKIKEIQDREKLPFLVGGTGLYIKAISENLKFPGVAPHPKLRKKLEKKSTKKLFRVYKKLDPKGAKHIDKHNKRRLIRAIEVCKISGEPFWEQRGKGKALFQTLKMGVKAPDQVLEEKIKKRAEKMFQMGLEKEVKRLFKKYNPALPAFNTIGYQEWRTIWKEGEPKSISKTQKEKIKNKIVTHTLQYAKGQMTWFRKEKNVHWVTGAGKAEKLVKEFLK